MKPSRVDHQLMLLARAREDLQEVIWELDPGPLVLCPDGKKRHANRSAFKSREMLQAAVSRIKKVYSHMAAQEAEKAGSDGIGTGTSRSWPTPNLFTHTEEGP